MTTSKCQPPKSPYHKNEFCACRDPSNFDPLFMENVNDISNTLAEIMIVCGIHRCKAEATKSIVVKAFKFYDVKRHQFEDTTFGIARDDIVNEFECKCSMQYMEALLAYDIVKRAVKAFYNDTPDYSIRSPVTEAVVLKEHRNAWQHAARKTARLFDQYEQIFFHAHHNYGQQIVRIYDELFSRIKNRADPVIVEDYHPRGCVKKVIIGTQSPPKLENEKQICVEKCPKEELQNFIENLPIKKLPVKNDEIASQLCSLVFNTKCPSEIKIEPKQIEKKPEKKNVDLNLPRCYECNCPKVICDCDIEPVTGTVAVDCSQGPFECQWFRVDNDDKPDPCIEKIEYHQCPIDCLFGVDSSESDEDCEYCKCSDDSDMEENDEEEEEEVYEPSDNEETLKRLMPIDMPTRANCHKHQTRNISKLPMMKACAGEKCETEKNTST